MQLAGVVDNVRGRPNALRVMRLVGYCLFFLLAFIPVLIWTFPLQRFSARIEHVLTEKLGRRVHIESLGTTLRGNVVLRNVEIEGPREEPSSTTASSTEKDSIPTKTPRLAYLFEEVIVDIGLLDLLLGQLDISIDAEAFGGELHSSYEGPLPSENKNDQQGRLSVVTTLKNLSLAQLPDIRARLPLRVSGVLNLTAELESQTGQFAQADGQVRIELQNVVLGKAGEPVLLSDIPMTFDPIALARLDGQMKIEKGKALVERVILESKHFDLKVQGGIDLRDPLEASELDLTFVFKILDAYRNLNARTQLLLPSLESFSPELQRAKREDGSYGLRYRGRLGQGKFVTSPDIKAGHRGWLAEEGGRYRPVRDPGGASSESMDARPLAERFGVTGQMPGAPPGMVEAPTVELPQPTSEAQE